jgi:hypothetical protein
MVSKKFLNSAAVTALTMVFGGGVAAAQETTSSIRGEVTTNDGQPIVGAEVTIIHEPTGAVSSEATIGGGLFDVRGLRPGGPFTVEFSAPGYQPEVYEGVFLNVGDPFRIVVDLDAAQNDEPIVITAQRRSSIESIGSATSLNRDAIDGVVSINRDIRDLARRDPLVSQNLRGDGGISIAGSNPRTNRITIGGVQAQDDFGLNTGGFPTRRGPVSLDAVQEFAVQAVPFDVENGDFLGGALDVVLAGGTNQFRGSAFVNYLNEGLVGTRISGTDIRVPRSQENWGATLRGPIIPNALFFALSYETYTSIDGTSFGPAGEGYANGFAGLTGASNTLTRANIEAATNVFRSGYGSTFAFGDITPSKPITDEKYSAQLDWDITDDHRATLVYRVAESGLIQRTNLGSTSAGLDSQWYLTGEEDTTYSLQLNSDWTDRLSTEVRYSFRDYERAQAPPSGQAFADISVCLSPTALDTAGTLPFQNCRIANNTTGVSVVRFGPDQFRHANELATSNEQLNASAEYELGTHLLKVGFQWQRTDVTNLFVPQSDGVYYFDSIADFAAGRANQLVYQNAITNNPNDAAAIFSYDVLSFFAQDSWDITDTLSVNYGVRYDTYSVDGVPARNPNFINRYGFSNQTTYDGLDVIMPRLSFEYEPTDNLEIAGGVGLFSGGIPDVFISNSFSNTGILTNSLTFQRTPTALNATSFQAGASNWLTETTGAVNCLTTSQTCLDALNVPVNSSFGSSIPASVRAALGGTTSSPTSDTNSIAPNFEMPSEWKANLSVGFEVAEWNLGFDLVRTWAQEEIGFRDLRVNPLVINGTQARTPDGRLRYDNLSSAQRTAAAGAGLTVTSTARDPGTGRDIQLYNPNAESVSTTIALSAGREWDNGVSLFGAYTWQESDSLTVSTRFSSTASSLYGGYFADVDPNGPAIGRSFDEIGDAFKLQLTWRRNFVGDLETRFDLFAETRTGRTSSFVASYGGGRNASLGVNRGGQLAYIPNMSNVTTTAVAGGLTIASDPIVVFDSQASINNLQAAVNRFGIPQGGIVPVGSYENRNLDRVDLNISQELPGFFSGHSTELNFQIGNVLNLLNDEWGRVEEFGDTINLYNVSCAGATGLADNLGVAQCSRYRISNVTTNFTSTRNVDASLWFIQVGLRYRF